MTCPRLWTLSLPNIALSFSFRLSFFGIACCCCQVTSVVSDSVLPHRWQPTRFPRPWDSPGKNTGVGCHFLLQCMKVKGESEVAQLCLALCKPMDCSPAGSSVHGIFQARVLEWVAIAFSIGIAYPPRIPMASFVVYSLIQWEQTFLWVAEFFIIAIIWPWLPL